MKELQADNGGRPFVNNDILTLQAEVYDAVEATLQGAQPMVLSGCQVSQAVANGPADISAGYLWLAGGIQRYPGANGVTLPVEVVAGQLQQLDLRPYQTGGSRACMRELELLTQADGTAPAGTDRVRFVAGGPTRTHAKWLESKVRQLGDLQDSITPAADLCDATGLGQGARLGWALANGNNGTQDLRRLFRVAYSDSPADAASPYATVGNTGGAATVTLTVPQLPAHAHAADVFHEGNDPSRIYGVFVGQQNGAPGGQARASVGSVGSDQPHENLPPYYVTVVWQWVGLS